MTRRPARRAAAWTGAFLLLSLAAGTGAAMAQRGFEKAQLERNARLMTGGDPTAGRALIGRYGCGGCHTIPGVRAADGLVGPPLTRFGKRVIIAGKLSNSPANLTTWLRSPQSVVPGNAMPDMGLSEAQARDIAAYLYTLG